MICRCVRLSNVDSNPPCLYCDLFCTKIGLFLGYFFVPEHVGCCTLNWINIRLQKALRSSHIQFNFHVQQINFFRPYSVLSSAVCMPLAYVHRDYLVETYFRLFGLTPCLFIPKRNCSSVALFILFRCSVSIRCINTYGGRQTTQSLLMSNIPCIFSRFYTLKMILRATPTDSFTLFFV